MTDRRAGTISLGGGAPIYRVRISPRASYARLQVTANEGLTVVVPRGFDQTRLLAIVEGKRDWVEKQLRRLAEVSEARAEEASLPERLDLTAIDEIWSVEYRSANTRRIGVNDSEPGKLIVYGAVAAGEGCREAMRLWLRRRARETLVPELTALAREKGFHFKEALIRGQKRRWASCSAKGTICLSYKLLFLEPWAARSVLLHELCHTVVMNHSPRFWALLSRFDPQCKTSRKAMRCAESRVPAWVDA
ncbi:MAG: DUF45 domain-containing protein [Syntrophaceae bacterium]|nr:DUF45 domain-containing protein [Syntrophaceae bacterium]